MVVAAAAAAAAAAATALAVATVTALAVAASAASTVDQIYSFSQLQPATTATDWRDPKIEWAVVV